MSVENPMVASVKKLKALGITEGEMDLIFLASMERLVKNNCFSTTGYDGHGRVVFNRHSADKYINGMDIK